MKKILSSKHLGIMSIVLFVLLDISSFFNRILPYFGYRTFAFGFLDFLYISLVLIINISFFILIYLLIILLVKKKNMQALNIYLFVMFILCVLIDGFNIFARGHLYVSDPLYLTATIFSYLSFMLLTIIVALIVFKKPIKGKEVLVYGSIALRSFTFILIVFSIIFELKFNVYSALNLFVSIVSLLAYTFFTLFLGRYLGSLEKEK